MKTFKQIWAERGKAVVNGKVWQVWDVSVRGDEVILLRDVKVKPHLRRIGDYRVSSSRTISIRRPVHAVAQEA